MEQLTQTKFKKGGVVYSNISSPATLGGNKQVEEFVEKEGVLNYKAGGEFKPIKTSEGGGGTKVTTNGIEQATWETNSKQNKLVDSDTISVNEETNQVNVKPEILNAKQDTLTAGENIKIENNVISATGGGGGTSNVTDAFKRFIPSTVSWEAVDLFGDIDSQYVWYTKDNIYYSNNNIGMRQGKYNKATKKFEPITWNGATPSVSTNIWHYNGETYLNGNYKLNESTLTWESKAWGAPLGEGRYFWTDGEYVYNSYETKHYRLDKDTMKFKSITFSGVRNFRGDQIFMFNGTVYLNTEPKVLYKLVGTTWTLIENGTNWGGTIGISNLYMFGNTLYYLIDNSYYIVDVKDDVFTFSAERKWNHSIGELFTDGENLYSQKSKSAVAFKLNYNSSQLRLNI